MVRIAMVLAVLAAACGSKKTESTDKGSGSATSTTGSATGSGSADTGSGSGSAVADAGSGSAADTGSGSAADTGSGSAVAVADDFDFDKLTHDEKVDFMKKQVMPVMKAAFQKFDPKEYKNFTCKTCHGKDPQKAKYKMPNAALPKLDFAKLREGKQEPKVAEWMEKVIKPEMAKILHEPEYTESNPDGFGCLHCHEMKK